MKKYKLLGLSVLLISIFSISACASKPAISNSDISSENEITFNKKTYSLAYNREFNDDVVPPEFFKEPFHDDNNGGNTHWYDNGIKNVQGLINGPMLYVKDGAAHLLEHHYIDENGLFHQDQGELRGITFNCDSWGGHTEKIEHQYFGEGYYEFKFKMPNVQGTSLAIFLYSNEGHEEDLTIGHENEKGYAWTEVDFCETKPLDGGKYIEPMGGFHISKVKTKEEVSSSWQFNEDWRKTIKTSKEWFDEWHTLQAVWEGNTMKLYYDGVYFRTVSVPKYMGSAQGKYSLYIIPQYCDYPWDDNPSRNKVDWSDNEVHDFQFDYIRYYTLKK